MKNVKLSKLSILHPDLQVDNEYFITHFDLQNKDIRSFLDHMGRKKRYIIKNHEENALTLSKKISSSILRSSNLIGEDIDLIVYATQTPEYLIPSNSMLIHKHIEAKLHTVVMDLNSNCSGMLTAIDVASRYMMTSKDVNRALLLGADYHRLFSSPMDEISYPNFGDGVSAIILEATMDSSDIGFIDSIGHSSAVVSDKILFPPQGLTKMLSENQIDNYLTWEPFSTEVSNNSAVESINLILERNKLSISDIGLFCFSQFSLADITAISNTLGIEISKLAYSGDKYGYTGASSPIYALHDAIENNQVKKGDYIVFWSVGAGFQTMTILYKY